MAYTIHYDFSKKYEGRDYKNLTWDLVAYDDDKLIDSDEFEYFYEAYEGDNIKEVIEKFKNSDDFLELKNNYNPIYNYVHILQYKPTEEQIELLRCLCYNIVIVYIEELDVYGIALTVAGLDFRDEIELAYYIIDGVSPVKAIHIDLDIRIEKLIKYCRDVVKKDGWISFDKIQKFIEG